MISCCLHEANEILFLWVIAALTDPDLLRVLLGHAVNDIQTLLATIRVSHAWFSEAADLLWRCAPLLCLYDVYSQRRQLYTPGMHQVKLSMWVANAVPDALAGLDFPRLQHLHLVNGWSVDATDGHSHVAARYLRPSVTELGILTPIDTARPRTYELLPGPTRDKFPDQQRPSAVGRRSAPPRGLLAGPQIAVAGEGAVQRRRRVRGHEPSRGVAAAQRPHRLAAPLARACRSHSPPRPPALP